MIAKGKLEFEVLDRKQWFERMRGDQEVPIFIEATFERIRDLKHYLNALLSFKGDDTAVFPQSYVIDHVLKELDVIELEFAAFLAENGGKDEKEQLEEAIAENEDVYREYKLGC